MSREGRTKIPPSPLRRRISVLSQFLQFVFSGVTVGAMYALAALGYSLIYNASGVINFAQGEFIMLGCGLPHRSRLAAPTRHRAGGRDHRVGRIDRGKARD